MGYELHVLRINRGREYWQYVTTFDTAQLASTNARFYREQSPLREASTRIVVTAEPTPVLWAQDRGTE
jgi:hypothetical protein